MKLHHTKKNIMQNNVRHTRKYLKELWIQEDLNDLTFTRAVGIFPVTTLTVTRVSANEIGAMSVLALTVLDDWQNMTLVHILVTLVACVPEIADTAADTVALVGARTAGAVVGTVLAVCTRSTNWGQRQTAVCLLILKTMTQHFLEAFRINTSRCICKPFQQPEKETEEEEDVKKEKRG